jgi:hypothetical protein
MVRSQLQTYFGASLLLFAVIKKDGFGERIELALEFFYLIICPYFTWHFLKIMLQEE